MAIIAYRPELESPARDASLALAFKRESGESKGAPHSPMEFVTLNPGVNRGIKDADWDLVRESPAVKALMKIKAIREISRAGDVDPEEEVTPLSADVEEVRGLPIEDVLSVIEASFDEKFLEDLQGADPRKTVKGKIIARLATLREGKG
jgi:hypothetical protein